uniref:Neural cell adhesion molecule 1a n=1 Tax=Cyprinodon variegatus TaxID=28743 RepID=A0A3Q2CKQ5_CYPVA
MKSYEKLCTVILDVFDFFFVVRPRIFTSCLETRYPSAIQVQITPSQGEISVGESKFFLCEVVGDAKEIDWFSPTGDKILPNRPNISVSSTDEATSVLTIYHATVDNAGTYKCIAKNGDKEAQATVQVKIFQKITFVNAASPQEFNEGDSAEIICDVVSSPPPSIIWKHKGVIVDSSKDVRYKFMENGHLVIRGIKKADEGTYSCEARVNTRGEIDFRMIKVIVNVLPTIRPRKAEVNATADVGDGVLLACDADGFPEPTVTWTHNDVVLQMGEKYSLNEDGSELVINDVQKVDEGDYTCIAVNKAGRKAEIVSLNVFVLPRITYFNNNTASEFDEEVTLTCEASGDPTPTISWRFGDTVFIDGEQSLDRNVVVRSHARVSSLTLKNVQYTDAGHYLCVASNSIGEDNQEVFLEVRYAPKIWGFAVSWTWEGNPANLSCLVRANPRASVVWYRDGVELPSENSTNIRIFNTHNASHLEITPESQSDFGSYNCTATNGKGSDSKEFLLVQADVPGSPIIEEVQPFSSTAKVVFKESVSSGGVPVLKYRVEWRLPGREWKSEEYKAEAGDVIIDGLKPETTYEVKMSAINGKGEGESSRTSLFKTEPVREPNAPLLEVMPIKSSNTVKIKWTKQDDGGSPIKHLLVRYKAKHVSDWKPELKLPPRSEYVILNGLDWNTDYEVHVVAENQRGRSEPSITSFRTATEPTAIPDAAAGGSGLGTGAIVGILIAVFLLLLVAVDVTCYFLNKCGLLMCIAVNVCGKAGPGAKSKDIEEGKAKTTDVSKPIPLSIIPAAADSPHPVVNVLPSTAANSVTESLSTPQTNPSDLKPSPKNTTEALSSSPKADPECNVGPLVDLSDTPKQPPASSPPVLEPVSPPSANADGPQSQCESVKAPNSTQSKDSQVDGSSKDTSNAPCSDSTSSAGPCDDNTVKDENAKAETEVKNATTEVKTVPNEAPQANGNESKA